MATEQNTREESLKRNMQALIYYLTKLAARDSFIDFLEHAGLTEPDYEEIKLFWERQGFRPYC